MQRNDKLKLQNNIIFLYSTTKNNKKFCHSKYQSEIIPVFFDCQKLYGCLLCFLYL